jgi:GTP pyrophosphokinase
MVIAHDRSGLLRDITSILANEQVNVLGANTLTDQETSIARMGLTLEITDVVQLSRVLDKIGQLPNVMEAYRKS